MDNDLKILQTIYKDSEMNILSINKILEKLDKNPSKLKIDLENCLSEYEKFRKSSKRHLRENKKLAKERGTLTKLSNNFVITMELLKDNSDEVIANMIMKNIKTSIREIRLQIKDLNSGISDEIMNLVEEFQKYQRDEVKILKEYVQ